MKVIICLLCISIVLGCRKEVTQNIEQDYIGKIKAQLKDSLGVNEYSAVDFQHFTSAKIDSGNCRFVRLPLVDKNSQGHFIFLKTTVEGTIQNASVVTIEERPRQQNSYSQNPLWSGTVTIQSLNKEHSYTREIVNGKTETPAAQSRLSFPPLLFFPFYSELPVVVVVSTVSNTSSGYSFSNWFNAYSLFFDYGGGGNGGGAGWGWNFYYFNNPDPGGGGGGGTGTDLNFIAIDYENQDEDQAIDLEKFVNCFNQIPDNGSTCSIEIFSDIPVDTDPNKIFDVANNSPGHTFINVRKTNGNQSASQNIGFYPASGWKTVLTNAPIDGKFVNNQHHEFNCGLQLDLTPAQLTHVLNEMLRTKNHQYDIDNYNCTDWALDVFNAAGGFQLEIPLYDIPGNVPSTGTRMPNGVFNKLKEMKTANHPMTPNITIDILKGYAGGSTGPCN